MMHLHEQRFLHRHNKLGYVSLTQNKSTFKRCKHWYSHCTKTVLQTMQMEFRYPLTTNDHVLVAEASIIFVISDLFLLCFRARLFIDALWIPAGKGLTSLLSFVMSNCEVVTFPLVSWVRCGA